MARLPKVLVTSVVRSTQVGESHGGVYVVDLEAGRAEQVLDWNRTEINWEGRGGDRGLRGAAILGEEIYIAASDELFVFDRQFNILRSFRNPFLSEAHEIFIHEGKKIFLTSTPFDSVLEFDIASGRFVKGHVIEWVGKSAMMPDGGTQMSRSLAYRVYNPMSGVGPMDADTTHINSVWVEGGVIYVAGVAMERVLTIQGPVLRPYGVVPLWTHNARPFRGGLLYNSTGADAVCWTDLEGRTIRSWPIVKQANDRMTHTDVPQDHARASFARGLCTTDELVIVGSSPSTVTAYRLDRDEMVASVNLTMDVRNCVHGLTLWPW